VIKLGEHVVIAAITHDTFREDYLRVTQAFRKGMLPTPKTAVEPETEQASIAMRG
jgi:hypothetical protein